jgi:uncharacterized membrane protein
MKFFGVPGLTLIIFSVLVLGYFSVLYFQEFKITQYRNYLILGITLFLVGLQLLVFAFIADMIKSNRKLTEDQMYMIKKQRYQ